MTISEQLVEVSEREAEKSKALADAALAIEIADDDLNEARNNISDD